MADPISSFGCKFPPEMPLIQRRLICARHGIGNVPRWQQRKEIIKALWKCSEPGDPPGQYDYAFHRWTDRRLQSTSEHNFVTWAAGSGSGKTSDAAMQALEWWLELPFESAVIVCSTTMKMLRMRIFGEVARYHSMLTRRFGKSLGNIGELIDSANMVRWSPGDSKHGIFGIAVEEGPIDEVTNNLIGIHTTRIWLILDEMQGVRDAIVSSKVLSNIASNPEPRFLGMGNPERLLDPLGRRSEPLSGWPSVNVMEDEVWATNGGAFGAGTCHRYDARHSPADDSPEERTRLSWLNNATWLAGKLKEANGNPNDPAYLSQGIGTWPMLGGDSTLLDDAILTRFHVQEKAAWTHGYTMSAALDPSFGGADKAVLQFLKRGEAEIERVKRWQIEFTEWLEVPIDTKLLDEMGQPVPVHYQVVNFCKKECAKRGVTFTEFALDSSGEGGGLKAIFDREWGPVIGIEFGGRPSDTIVDASLQKTARDAYDTRASEINFTLRRFALADGLRGMSAKAAAQCCARKTFYKGGKWCVEPKTGSKGQTDASGRAAKGFKQRLGYSPDHAEACAIGAQLCVIKGAAPSGEVSSVGMPAEDWNRLCEKAAASFDDSNYLIAQ